MVDRSMSAAPFASAGAFLERAEGLRALEGALTAVVASGEGRLLLVTGEAGVGKTALLRRFSRSQERTIRVLWGSCEPWVTPRPLGPLFDVGGTVGGALEELVLSGRPAS
jgi:predicted ATPase